MTRIGAALDLRFGKNNLQFLDFLHSNGFDHIEIKKDNDHVYGEVKPAELLGNRINAVHLHDNNSTSDEHLALGKGSLDLDSGFVKELDNCMSGCNGRCSTYVFEMKTLSDFISSKEYFALL